MKLYSNPSLKRDKHQVRYDSNRTHVAQEEVEGPSQQDVWMQVISSIRAYVACLCKSSGLCPLNITHLAVISFCLCRSEHYADVIYVL